MSNATNQLKTINAYAKQALAIGAKLKNKDELTNEDIKAFDKSHRDAWNFLRENIIAEEAKEEAEIIERRLSYILIEVKAYLIIKNTNYQDIYSALESIAASIFLYHEGIAAFKQHSKKELPNDLPEKITLINLGITDEVIKPIVMSHAENDLIANYPAYLANHKLSADQYKHIIDRLVYRITSTPYTVDEWFNTLYASTKHKKEAELIKHDIIQHIKWLKANHPDVLEKNKKNRPILFELE